MVTTVWHLNTLRKCDFMGKRGANGKRVEIRKRVNLFAPRRQWTYGNLPARGTDVIKWLWQPLESKISNLKFSKWGHVVSVQARNTTAKVWTELNKTFDMAACGPRGLDITGVAFRHNSKVQPTVQCSIDHCVNSLVLLLLHKRKSLLGSIYWNSLIH